MEENQSKLDPSNNIKVMLEAQANRRKKNTYTVIAVCSAFVLLFIILQFVPSNKNLSTNQKEDNTTKPAASFDEEKYYTEDVIVWDSLTYRWHDYTTKADHLTSSGSSGASNLWAASTSASWCIAHGKSVELSTHLLSQLKTIQKKYLPLYRKSYLIDLKYKGLMYGTPKAKVYGSMNKTLEIQLSGIDNEVKAEAVYNLIKTDIEHLRYGRLIISNGYYNFLNLDLNAPDDEMPY